MLRRLMVDFHAYGYSSICSEVAPTSPHLIPPHLPPWFLPAAGDVRPEEVQPAPGLL